MAEHRALQAGRADVDPEEIEQIIGPEGLDLGDLGAGDPTNTTPSPAEAGA